MARDAVLRDPDLWRRARRLSPHPQRSKLVLQHHPRRAGGRARPGGFGRVPALDALRAAGKDWLGVFATFLFTHNSQIAIFAFALGFAFAVPTLLLIIYNGLMLGAFLAVFSAKGLGLNVAAWLMIHGTTEIFAICISGAAGIRIGMAIAFPDRLSRIGFGRSSRADGSDRHGRGRSSCSRVAGLLEGVGRQTILNDGLRALIGAAVLAAWLVYFYAWRSKNAEYGK